MRIHRSLQFRLVRVVELLSILAIVTCGSAQAATIFWNGTGTDWGTAANWSTNAVPVAADTTVFNVVGVDADQIVNLNGARPVGAITVNSIGSVSLLGGSGSSTLTLSGSITMSPGAGSLTVGSSTIGQEVPISIGGNRFWSNNSSSAVTIQNGITATATARLFLGGTGSGGYVVNGGLTSSAGTLSLLVGTYKNTTPSANSVTLTAANSYGGSTDVWAGTLTLTGANGANSGAGTYGLWGGSFVVDNAGANNTARIADTSKFQLNGGNFIYLGSSSADSTETTGTFNATAATYGGSTITVSYGGTNKAELTAAAFIHAGGDGTNLVNGVNLGMDDTSTGSVARFFLTAAPVQVGTTTALGTGIDAATQNTKIVPFLVGEATQTTGGLGTASGTANTFLTYNAGTGLRPLNPTDEFTNNSIVTGNNTYITAATTATADDAINSLVINGGDLTINDSFTLSNSSGALLFVSNNTIGGSGTTGAFYRAGTGATENQITVNAGVTGTMNAWLLGTGTTTKSGYGTLTMGGDNSGYSGRILVRGGTLQAGVGSVNPFGNNSPVVMSAKAGATLDLNNNNVTIGSLSGGSNLGGNVVLGSGTLTVGSDNTNQTYGGSISGSGGLTKTGTGTFTLGLGTDNFTGSFITYSGNSTYTGATTVENGTLVLARPASEWVESSSVINLGDAASITNGYNVTFYANSVNPISRDIIVGASGAATSGTYTIGNLSGNGNQNTWTGNVTLNQSLTINSTVSSSSSNVGRGVTLQGSITSGASGVKTLTFNPANLNGFYSFVKISGVISDGVGQVAVTQNGPGRSILSGSNTYTGDTTVLSGTLQAEVASVPGVSGPFGVNSAVTIADAANAALNLNNKNVEIGSLAGGGVTGGKVILGTATLTTGGNNTDTDFAGVISGAGGLAKVGTGAQTLSGVNTYTGPTEVLAGTLVVSGQLNAGSAVTVGDWLNMETSAVLGGGGTVGDVTVGAIPGNTGAMLKPHAGSLSTSAGTTLNTGALTFDGSAHLALELGRTSAFSTGGGDGAAGGDVSDHVNASGAISLNGADLSLSLLSTTGYSPVVNDVLFLIINGGVNPISGEFGSINGIATTLTEGSTFTLGGNAFQITYSADFSANSFTGGNDVALLMVIPEPASWMMLLGGAGVLTLFRRRSIRR